MFIVFVYIIACSTSLHFFLSVFSDSLRSPLLFHLFSCLLSCLFSFLFLVRKWAIPRTQKRKLKKMNLPHSKIFRWRFITFDTSFDKPTFPLTFAYSHCHFFFFFFSFPLFSPMNCPLLSFPSISSHHIFPISSLIMQCPASSSFLSHISSSPFRTVISPTLVNCHKSDIFQITSKRKQLEN